MRCFDSSGWWSVAQCFIFPNFILVMPWMTSLFVGDQVTWMVVIDSITALVPSEAGEFGTVHEGGGGFFRCWFGNCHFIAPWGIEQSLIIAIIWHFEDHFHVMRGASTAHSSMEVLWRRRGNEVVILTRVEFQAAWCRWEWSKRDGKVQQLMWLAANGNDDGLGIGDATRIKLFAADTVDDMPLWLVCAMLRYRTDDVDLVIFAW